MTLGTGTLGSGTFGDPTATASVSVRRELPPDDVALYVEAPDGTSRRIAGDELSLPLSDYTTASTLPGGHSTLDGDVTLPERGIVPFGKFARVSAKLDDGTEIWGGRVESTPERSDERTLSLSCIGHQAALVDAAGIVFLGVTSDMSAWEEPPRKYVMQNSGTNSINAAFDVDISEEGVTIRLSDRNKIPATARGEVWFRAPAGQTIGEIQYVGSNALATNMGPTVRAYTSLSSGAVDSEALTLDLSVRRWTPDPVGNWASFRDTPTMALDSGSDAPAKAARVVALHAISVFGNHDLPRAAIEDLPDGLYFSDVLAYLIGQHAPFLSTSIGGESTIEQSSYAMPSAAWLESTDLASIIEDGIRFEAGRDWAVWGTTLHYGRRENMGRTWTVRRSEGARFIDSGATAEPDYNGVVVVFTDSDGRERRAGPPGWAGYDYEDTSLQDPDPDNPANASSVVGNRPLIVEVGDSKPDKAIELGQLALEESLRRRFSGEVELPRYAEREGVTLPTNMIRAGDRIVDGDSDRREELPLVGASYNRSAERPFQGSIDTPSNRLDAALARIESRPRKVNRKKIRGRYRHQRNARQRARRRAHRREERA